MRMDIRLDAQAWRVVQHALRYGKRRAGVLRWKAGWKFKKGTGMKNKREQLEVRKL
jgi:hypothetical protein